MKRAISGGAPLMSQEDADGDNEDEFTSEHPAGWWATLVADDSDTKVRGMCKKFLLDAKAMYPERLPNINEKVQDWSKFMTHFFRRLGTNRAKLGGCDRDTRNAARGEAKKESDPEKAYLSKILIENAKAQVWLLSFYFCCRLILACSLNSLSLLTFGPNVGRLPCYESLRARLYRSCAILSQ